MPWLNFRLAAARIIAAGGKAMRVVVTEGGRTEPAPGLYSKLSLFSFAVFCLNVLTLLYFYGVAGYNDLVWGARYSEESAPVELLTAGLFGGAGLVLGLAAVAAGRGWLRRVYILAGLGLFFIAGEELSWGQHIWGFTTPGFLEEINLAGEVNLHNTYVANPYVLITGHILRTGVPILASVATVAAFHTGRYRLGRLPLPSLWLAFFFAMEAMLHREVSLAEAVALEGGALLPIMGVFLGVALLTRDKRLLLAVVALIMLSGAIFSVRGTFALHDPVTITMIFREVGEYLLGLAAFLYGLQLLREGGREPWRTWWRRVKRAGARPEAAADSTHTHDSEGWSSGRRWGYHSWRWAWPAACLLVAGGSIGLAVLDRQFDAALQREYQTRLTTQPTVSAGYWDLYYRPGRMDYVKNSACARGLELEERFFLHILAIDAEDLPAYHRARGFQHLDFRYEGKRKWFLSGDGKCVAVVELPDYPIAQIYTGQHDSREVPLWSVRLDLDADYYRAAYQTVDQGKAGAPLTRGIFDLYRYDNALYYFKESCAPADVADRFFLHLVPENPEDLPAERRPHSFSNLDFDFNRRGHWFDGKCLAVVELPDYPITEIRTGQFTAEGALWEVALPVGN